MFKYRKKCVLCDDVLVTTNKLDNFPVSFSPVEKIDYSFYDLEFGMCYKCDSLQLQTLVDPENLYENQHNITYNTPTWKTHHEQFSIFIIDNTRNRNFLEIGGSSGILESKLRSDSCSMMYYIIDICENDTRDTDNGIVYIKGNCETFDFTEYNNNTFLMSHVFEHLYNPRIFVENLLKNNVNEIFISLPNMEYLYNSNSIFVHVEHTFYCSFLNIINLFNNYNYSCIKSQYFKNHSIFFHFKLKDSVNQEYKFRNMKKSVDFKDNSYIIPAGHYGQMLYFNSENKKKVKGFIDNDTSKQGKYMNGTNLKIYSFDNIKDDNDINIYIYAGPYTNELYSQAKNKFKNANINSLNN